MSKNAMILIGGLIIIISAIIKYFIPVKDMGWSINQSAQLCNSGLGVLAVAFSSDAASACSEISLINNLLTAAIVVGGLVLLFGFTKRNDT